ncbi:DUF4157 domain-containing protein [Streptomyces sp. NPDC047985]|uniref:eCIS core domain-containing protein n=1 Tax=Streptomyces sp. NPDC047985 TaxID=3155384 RepID=UPI003413603B
MLGQAGHRSTEEQQHAAGCGHDQAEQPAVQRSAVHDVLRAPGRPLDDETREDMEARFGADFSDVRIHDDSAARASAAEVGARAYTSGNHVVIGDDGADEHTLAHELTHVIQQRQGPVAGADNGNGLKVSDPSDRYEREAEANATRVMRAPASAAAPEHPRAGRPRSTETVQRAVVAQVESGDGRSVSEIHFAGRPESPYSGTMGDHSTAYVVQQEAVKRAVKGKTPLQAAQHIQALVARSAELPGVTRSDNLPQEMKDECDAALRELNETINLITGGNVPEGNQFPLVQKMVSNFLHFRELIPFTTMNVAAVSQGRAGKGKAESGSNRTLSECAEFVAMNPGVPLSNQEVESVKLAMWKIMDRDGVALVATEHRETVLQELAPGMNPALLPGERCGIIIEQHLTSIEMAYPGIIGSVFGAMGSAKDAFMVEMGPVLAGRKEENKLYYAEELKKKTVLIEDYQNRGMHEGRGRSKAYEREVEVWYELAEGLKFNGGGMPDFPAPRQQASGRTLRSKFVKSSTMSFLAETLENANLEADRGAMGPSWSNSATPAGGQTAHNATMRRDDDSERQYLTSQVEVTGGRISAYHSAGRSPSPFSGTMGAHTTAWIAHLDSIRTNIVGRTLDEAARFIIDTAIPEARKMAETASTAFSFSLDEQGANHREKLVEAARHLEGSVYILSAVASEAGGNPLQAARYPLVLQQAINALLTFINFIPGATIDKSDTGGKAEGVARNNLLQYENGTKFLNKNELRRHIRELLDYPEDATPAQKRALDENHKRVVKSSYPKSARDAGIA